jgi:hypothetical protein
VILVGSYNIKSKGTVLINSLRGENFLDLSEVLPTAVTSLFLHINSKGLIQNPEAFQPAA